jgi:hypothetical protein
MRRSLHREGGPQCGWGWGEGALLGASGSSADSSTPQRTDQCGPTELTVNAHGNGVGRAARQRAFPASGRGLARSVSCQRGSDGLVPVEGTRRCEPHCHLPHQTPHHFRLRIALPAPLLVAPNFCAGRNSIPIRLGELLPDPHLSVQFVMGFGRRSLTSRPSTRRDAGAIAGLSWFFRSCRPRRQRYCRAARPTEAQGRAVWPAVPGPGRRWEPRHAVAIAAARANTF